MSETTIATGAQIEALPEKMRAHVAAKALGLASKELIAALAERGIEIKSAQSGVTREQLAVLAVDDEHTEPEIVTAQADTADEAASEPADSAQAAPAPRKTARRRTAKKAAGKPAAKEEVQEEAPAEPAEEDQSSSYAGFSIVTGEVGAAEERGRGGRGGLGRKRPQSVPGFSPLFLTPGDAPAKDSGISVITVTGDDDRGDAGADAGPDTGSDTGPDTGSGNADDSDEADGSNRRRRRGRRGRGRGRGEEAGRPEGTGSDESADDNADGADDGRDGGDGRDAAQDSERANAEDGKDGNGNDTDSDADTDTDNADGQRPEGSSSRRRRRRRRKSGGGEHDGDNSRNDNRNDNAKSEKGEKGDRRSGGSTDEDEIQGISGSTRLEAKRRRRRPGGDGRRRHGILSEAEFLARREEVDRVMVVRERERHDGSGALTQVGVLEDKVLVEHFVTTEAQRSMVGNVYLGRVQNVLPSMEAAFIDIGRGRNGVLYAGEVDWHAAGLGGKRRRIEQALKPGDQVLVQVTKDPVGQKGARLSTQVSLAGRFLVFVPGGSSTGISRKLPDVERKRLKAILKSVVPAGNGVIIRTAAEGVSEEDIRRDVERLSSKWEKISGEAERLQKGKGASVRTLYEEPDLLVKVVRDLFNEDFSKLVVQGEKSWNTVHDYVSELAPEMEDRLERFENDELDVFSVYRVDEQLHKALERTVWLPSGGTIVIDRTEAMTVVDVNTGKFTGRGGNLEETVTRNNLEAAEEIVRQLRLRDIGGMVIIDFIDMVLEANQDLVVRRLTEALGRDRTRHQVSEVTSLGLVQLTRKKLGTGLVEAFSEQCTHCGGRGIILREDPVLSSATSDDGGQHGRGNGNNGHGKGNGRGRGSGGGSGEDSRRDGHHGESAEEKKDGPNPSAHPMILAMSKGDSEDDAEPRDSAEPKRSGRRRSRRTVNREAGSAAAPEAQDAVQGDGDNPAHEVAEAVREAADDTAHVADSAEDLAPQPRKRSRRRIVRADEQGDNADDKGPKGQKQGQKQGQKSDKKDKPASTDVPAEPVAPEVHASELAVEHEGTEERRRGGRRRVTRSAGAADSANAKPTEGQAAPAVRVTQEVPVSGGGAVGSVTELTGEETIVPAETDSLAVVTKPKRRSRRTASRPAGEAG